MSVAYSGLNNKGGSNRPFMSLNQFKKLVFFKIIKCLIKTHISFSATFANAEVLRELLKMEQEILNYL